MEAHIVFFIVVVCGTCCLYWNKARMRRWEVY